jgi:RNA polymerase sigma-70 factor (ECF subfamily)
LDDHRRTVNEVWSIDTTGGLLVISGTVQSADSDADESRVPEAPRHADIVEAARLGDGELARVPWREVDDLVQDVFLLAFRRLQGLRRDTSFGPWLAMITRNRAVDFHRRSRKAEELPAEIHERSRSEAEADAERIIEVIRALPEAYRETLILRLVEGMSGPEIGERTGLTPASVRVNLHRGMKLLRESLGMEEKA